MWMIALKSSENFPWPWSGAGEHAEEVFGETYPSLYKHMKEESVEEALRKRQDQGRFWWELRSCAYWDEFLKPKIMYQEITWQLNWSFDTKGTLCNNTAYFLPTEDKWLLASINSPVSWWYAWRTAVRGKDEALRFIKEFVTKFPVAQPTDEVRALVIAIVERLTAIAESKVQTERELLDWLRVEHGIGEPSQKLLAVAELDSETFVAEVRKARGKKNPLSLAGLRSLREEHARTILPAQVRSVEALRLERKINGFVNQAYGLTPDEVELMWKTAPPRMPIRTPFAQGDSSISLGK